MKTHSIITGLARGSGLVCIGCLVEAGDFPSFSVHRIDTWGDKIGQTALVDVDRDGDLDWIAGNASHARRDTAQISWWEFQGADRTVSKEFFIKSRMSSQIIRHLSQGSVFEEKRPEAPDEFETALGEPLNALINDRDFTARFKGSGHHRFETFVLPFRFGLIDSEARFQLILHQKHQVVGCA